METVRVVDINCVANNNRMCGKIANGECDVDEEYGLHLPFNEGEAPCVCCKFGSDSTIFTEDTFYLWQENARHIELENHDTRLDYIKEIVTFYHCSKKIDTDMGNQ